MRILFSLLLLTTFLFASENTYFTTEPTISPDGKTIAFIYEEDIWTVPSTGGNAVRIVALDGRESNPVYSPDGKWLAFTGRQDGNPNVYVVPVEGGDIKQLTYNDRSDYAESWSWDSKTVYFGSTRYNQMAAFEVPVTGGTPKRILGDHFFNRIYNIFAHPNGSFYFNETWEAWGFAMRKHYKGDFNPDIKSYNPETDEFTVHTTWRGKDLWATADENGKVYFASDEANNEYNLYTFENGTKTQLTTFDSSIKYPQVSANGEKVVFEKDYQIYLYDAASAQAKLVPIKTYTNYTLGIDKEFNVSGHVSDFDVSPDGKKLAFVSRGELFVSDAEGKFVKQITTNPLARVLEVKWLKDNKTILFNQTDKGYLNIYTVNAATGETEQVTDTDMNSETITFNSDRTKALYFDGRNNLEMLDLESMDSETIVEDEFWGIYRTEAHFSPDDKFVAYTAYRNFEEDLFIYDIENKTTKHLTKTGVTETNPMWSSDGKYIYFTTDRYRVSYPWGFDDAEIYRVALRNINEDFKLEKVEKLFAEEEKKDTTKKDDKPEVKIDYKNISERWEGIATQPTNQYLRYVQGGGDETNVLFASNHDNEGWGLWKTTIKPFESNETKKISGISGNGYDIFEADGKVYAATGDKMYKLDLKGNKAEEISTSYTFAKDLRHEFEQMFYEAWANIEVNFYDGNFNGINWQEMRDKYGAYIPYIRTRSDLRTIFTDMLGELNASHTGFYSTGDEEETYYDNSSMTTGILFQADNPYTVERIATQSAADKDDVDIKQGDKLVAVDGVEIDEDMNREYYFARPGTVKELKLTFERNGSKHDVMLHPQASSALYDNLYDEWEDQRQKMVDEKSNNRIAYVHMPNMGVNSYREFYEEMTNEFHYKDALILDIRNNRGGNVHDMVLQFLSQKPYMKWGYRGGEPTPQPNFFPAAKPIVLLINEQSLSDAELTANGFKELGLGTIVGTETYRWIIFTSGKSLVDGSFYRLPSWGCYRLDGGDIEEEGVKPDIYLNNTFKDRLEGKDPQLQKAIDLIMQELE